MERRGNIVRATAEEIREILAREGDGTDWARVDATTQEEIERQAREDGTDYPEDWLKTATTDLPLPKRHVNLRIDADVLSWFKGTGKGYQTRINNVLRAFVESRKRAEG
jgi:uncharacterized protein (DUF4415 family)